MKKRKSFKCVLILLFAIVFILSFNGGKVSRVEAVAKIRLNKTKASVYIGETIQLRVKGTKTKIKWSSSDKNIASVNSKGKVKGKKVGTARIIAKVGKKKYRCKINVKNNQSDQTKEVNQNNYSDQKIEVSQNNVILTGNNNIAYVVISSKYPCEIAATNSNPSVATCSWNGNTLVITGKMSGTTRIVLTENLKSVSTIINVTVDYSDQTIEADQNDVKLTANSNSATINLKTKYSCTMSYTISDPNIVSCSWSGNQLIINGKEEGTTTITITNNLNSASATIKVNVLYYDIDFPECPSYLTDKSSYQGTKMYIVNRVYMENNYIYCDITKTYDSRGENQSSTCYVSWKLYKRGTKEVVASGSGSSQSLLINERDTKVVLVYSYELKKCEPGEYDLIILNTN